MNKGLDLYVCLDNIQFIIWTTCTSWFVLHVYAVPNLSNRQGNSRYTPSKYSYLFCDQILCKHYSPPHSIGSRFNSIIYNEGSCLNMFPAMLHLKAETVWYWFTLKPSKHPVNPLGASMLFTISENYLLKHYFFVLVYIFLAIKVIHL